MSPIDIDDVEISYRIVTPMFIGGAEPEKQAELRAPSLKGALRFWYRAINSDYREHEMEIFGGSGREQGQASFLLRIDRQVKSTSSKQLKHHTKYLAYGAGDKEQRPCIEEGGTFKIRIIFKPNTNRTHRLKVKRALWAFTMFGGLGSRSRKGFGSLIATKVSGMEELPTLMPEVNDLGKTIQAFMTNPENVSSSPDQLPEYSCWSKDSRCIVTGTNTKNALVSLEWLGRNIHDLRSTQGSNKFTWPKDDCAKMRAFSQNGITPVTPPLRTAFGLPHNYFFSDLENKTVELNFMDGNKKSRRASPLFFHVYEKSNKACIVATFLPAKLIPNGAQVTIQASKKIGTQTRAVHTAQLALPDNFQAISDILDKFKTDEYQGMEVER